MSYQSHKFAKEVEQEAFNKHGNKELARRQGEEAGSIYGAYLTAVTGGSYAANKWIDSTAAAAVTAGGTIAGGEIVKPRIKDHVMGKTEDDYNKPLFPGTTPPGPG